MISAIFVDRPRLAVVIAIVITIAGLLALTRIPVAQFPDIVPPQVQVSATYPGASAAVRKSTSSRCFRLWPRPETGRPPVFGNLPSVTCFPKW